jgi:hypothetical protein
MTTPISRKKRSQSGNFVAIVLVAPDRSADGL